MELDIYKYHNFYNQLLTNNDIVTIKYMLETRTCIKMNYMNYHLHNMNGDEANLSVLTLCKYFSIINNYDNYKFSLEIPFQIYWNDQLIMSSDLLIAFFKIKIFNVDSYIYKNDFVYELSSYQLIKEKVFDFSDFIHEINYDLNLRFILNVYQNDKIIFKMRTDNFYKLYSITKLFQVTKLLDDIGSKLLINSWN